MMTELKNLTGFHQAPTHVIEIVSGIQIISDGVKACQLGHALKVFSYMTLDLTLSPIYRINGLEIASLPGLIALAPPQTVARSREKDRLIAYLLLTGNSTFSASEYMQIAKDAANIFYQTSGALTSALRTAADHVNKILLERNMTSSRNGQFAIGLLTLAAIRDTQCTLALSGPMHVFLFSQNETRHIHEPAASGKGLGTNQTTNVHYSQTSLTAGDRLLFFGRAPDTWKSVLNDPNPGAVDAMRQRLISLSNADLNAVLIQAADGAGIFNISGETSESKVDKRDKTVPVPTPASQSTHFQDTSSTPEVDQASPPSAHIVQPSAYAIPPQQEEKQHPDPLFNLPHNTASRVFPASIPRIQPAGEAANKEISPPASEEEEMPGLDKAAAPAKEIAPKTARERSVRKRQTAKALASGIQFTRRLNETTSEKIKIFLPRLLPGTETGESFAPSKFSMFFIATLVPLIVVVVMFVMWSKYGRNPQYETYLLQAKEMSAQAASLTNPIEQRASWENVLLDVEKAEKIYHSTSDTILLRQEADANLDKLLGITRMQFSPAFSSDLGIKISRMAASETDLFLLNAEKGEAIRAQPSTNGRGFQIDTTFNCKPGVYEDYTVGHLVDILALPLLNSINTTLLGIDATGNLLYCAPGQIARAIPLTPPDTNWNHVTAFTISNGNLYVLDAPARAVWVYNGKDGNFVDRPYFFFGGQTPEKQDVIDLIIYGDDLYMLHADSHISICSYSRIETKPTRCQDPAPLTNPLAAYQDTNLFASANFTQMLFTALPDQSILLLDSDTQGVLRFAPRTLELQNQFRHQTGSSNPIPVGPAGAVAVSPNHVLYLAVNGQVYFAANMP